MYVTGWAQGGLLLVDEEAALESAILSACQLWRFVLQLDKAQRPCTGI